jgi:cell division protease FtsH
MLFKFKNSKGEFLKNISPVTYTNDESAAYVADLDLDSYNLDDVENKIVEPMSSLCKHEGALRLDILAYDESLGYFAIIQIKEAVMSVNINTTITSSIAPDKLENFKQFTVALSDYVVDLSMHITPTPSLSKMVDNIADALGMGKGSISTMKTTDVDEIIEMINTKTKATVSKPKEDLSQYVCNDTLMEELVEVKDFMENYKQYKDLSIEIPRGILFKGPPGTGKTYAARCIAGSTDCYFLSCTASSLQGMYIGSGTQNIRDIFMGAKQLKEASGKGVIIFIDELDSLGNRDSHNGGAGGEEDRTLNQLLAEMSGFEEVEQILVMGATNYPERLDDALMRSGRFSRQINIPYPTALERLPLVEHYFSKIKMELDDTEPMEISELTEGLTPADIKEIANEAAILCIRQKLSKINLDNINEAINKVITKNIRNKDTLDVHLVSAHECGHVLAQILYTGQYPIKVTSYSYGDTGGFTQPGLEKVGLRTNKDFINEIKMLLAGRAAEEAVCGVITNGASNDLEKAKKIIKAYYKYYNFSDYEVKELDQIIINDLNKYYRIVLANFQEPKNLDLLKSLTKILEKERVLYTKDLIRICTGVISTGGFIL